MINKFSANYPRVVEKVSKLEDKYPIELKLKMVINVSVLMCKLEKGCYATKSKLPKEVIDMLATNYIKNYLSVAGNVYNLLGKYELTEGIQESLLPDNFMKKLLNKYFN